VQAEGGSETASPTGASYTGLATGKLQGWVGLGKSLPVLQTVSAPCSESLILQGSADTHQPCRVHFRLMVLLPTLGS
jgi:hypothetical protein